jgi:DNA-binding winged helix-turn-helix (wHTH) protein
MAEEPSRRQLLRRTEDLLERVEQLRLDGVLRVPPGLGADITRTGVAITAASAQPPGTIGGAHRYLLRLQGALLSGRARVGGRTRRPAPTPPPVRWPSDLPWIALPRRDAKPDEASWREGVQQTVQRAHDLVRYLTAQSVAATGSGPDGELAARRGGQAQAAQRGFEALRTEAQSRTGGLVTLDPAPSRPTRGVVETEDLVIDLDRASVTQGGRPVRLTPVERSILTVLAANPGRAVSREALMHAVYGDDPGLEVRTRTVDVHVFNLRRKLGQPDWLATVPGVGYRSTAISLVSEDDLEEVRRRRREQRLAWAASSSPSPPTPTAGDIRGTGWRITPGR